MENITIGQIAAGIALIAGLIGGGKLIVSNIRDGITKIVKDALAPLTAQITDISDKLKVVDLESTKNFLVRCLSDVEKGDDMTETEKERFWEQYEHYVSEGGNTYIKNRVERLRDEGRL